MSVDPVEPVLSAAIDLPLGTLRVRGHHDAMAHDLLVVTAFGQPRVILGSVDFGPAETGLGPTSPVFQEPHTESDDRSLRLMLVGQWAKVHFSGVIEYRPDRSGELKFGIAARLRQPDPLRLASTYTLMAPPSQLREASDEMLEIAVPDTQLALRIEASENARIALAEAGRAAMRLQIMPRQGDPAESAAALPPRTIRWDYTLRLIDQA